MLRSQKRKRVPRTVHSRWYIACMSLLENTRATYDYEIVEKLEAGIELLGIEVKSLRAKLGSLKGARVLARGGEAYLVGATFPPGRWPMPPRATTPCATVAYC